MEKNEKFYDIIPELRKLAEEKLSRKNLDTAELTPQEIKELLHEFQVHQIELDMQNEELRNTQLELDESRAKYQDLYNFAPVGYLTVDEKGFITEANLTIAVMLGVEKISLINQPVFRFISLEDKDHFYSHLQKLFKLTQKQQFDLRMLKFGDKEFWAEVTVVLATGGKNLMGAISVTDITERKLAENKIIESEERYKRITKNITDYLYTVEVKEGKAVKTIHNDTCLAVTGYTSAEFNADSYLWINMIHPDERESVAGRFLKMLDGIDQTPIEHRIIKKGGEIRWVLDTTIPQYDQYGRLIAYDGVIKDITQRKEALEQIKRFNDRYTLAAKAAKIGIWDWDIVSDELIWDDEMYSLYGHSKEDFKGAYDAWLDSIHPDDKERANGEIEKSKTGEKDFDTEFRIILPDGSIRYIKASGEVYRDDSGKPVRELGINYDITEQRLVEEKLRESEERYRNMIQIIPDGVLIHTNGIIVFANDSALKIMRAKNYEQIIGIPVIDLVHPDYKEIVINRIKKSLNEIKTAEPKEEVLVTFDGLPINALVTAIPFTYMGNSSLLTVFTDITDRKRSEAALIESEGRYRKAQEVGQVGSWEYDIKNNSFWGSDEGKRVYGFNLTTDNFTADEVMNCVIEKDRVNQAMIDLIEKNEPYDIEFDIIPLKSSANRTIHSIAELVRDENGNPLKVTGIMHDVTERKRIETALRLSELKFRGLIEQASDGIFIANSEGNYLDVNPSGCDMLGYTRDEILKFNIKDLVGANDINAIPQKLDELRSGKVLLWERMMIKKGGKPLPVEISGKLLEDGRIQAIVRDVTYRKSIEEEQNVNIKLLRIINATSSKNELIRSVVSSLKEWLNCDAVGIRLKEGFDYPYYETSGFPEKFVNAERYLCSYNENREVVLDSSGNPALDCMCGNIICGRFDPSKPFFTKQGSFWSNCTTALLASTTEADRQARTRNRCNGEGYESVGLFPLRFKGETFGLLQINNKRKDLFTTEIISFLERIGDNLAIALSNHMAKDALQQSEEKYKKLFSEMQNGCALHEIICDDNGKPIDYRTLDINSAYESLMEVKADMVIGKKASEFLMPEELKHWLNIFAPVALTGKSTHYEMYSASNMKYFEGIAYSPEAGKFAVVFYDVTERRLIEEKVREKDIQFRKLSSQLPGMIYQFTRRPDGSYYVPIASIGIKNIFGCLPEDVLDDFAPIGRVIIPEDSARVNSDIEYSAKHLTFFTCEFRVQIPGKPIQWIYSRSTPEKLADGSITWYGFNTDITERKRSEKMFQDIIDKNPMSIQIVDKEGFMLHGNPAFIRLFGTPPPKDFSIFADLEKKSPELEELIMLAKSGEVVHLPDLYYNPNNVFSDLPDNPLWIRAIVFPLLDSNGNPERFVFMHENITEYKQSEELLKASELKFRTVADYTFDWEYWENENKQLNYISPSCERITGYNPIDFINNPKLIEDIVHPDDLDCFHNHRGTVASSGHLNKPEDVEFRIIKKSGAIVYINHICRPIYDENKNFLGRRVSNRDITERKYAEKVIIESERKFRKLTETANDAIISITGKGEIISWNESAERIFGYTFEEIFGQNVNQIIPKNHSLAHSAGLEGLSKGNKPRMLGRIINIEAIQKDGIEFPIELSLSSWESGGSVYYSAIIRDITERVKSQRELELYRYHLEELVKSRTEEVLEVNKLLQKELEKEKEFEMMLQQSLEKEKELNEMKTRFISTTSHEFRTPLTALSLSADLVKRYGNKWDDAKKNVHFDRIRNSVLYLTKLLDDILTLSRTETGKINNKPEQIDLFKFALECTEDAKSIMKANHELKLDFKSKVKEFYLDPKLMKFILNNLLSNAVKYSPDGGMVELMISSNKKHINIEVTDNGIGIPADEVDKIFESFYRSKNAEEMAGTGLGLAIVKRAVDLQNGEIAVRSQLNKGTTVTVKVPRVEKEDN